MYRDDFLGHHGPFLCGGHPAQFEDLLLEPCHLLPSSLVPSSQLGVFSLQQRRFREFGFGHAGYAAGFTERGAKIRNLGLSRPGKCPTIDPKKDFNGETNGVDRNTLQKRRKKKAFTYTPS
jgi:hypothetical protein